MVKKLKIAIYSGAIPSTTFIEHLIKGVSKTHTVYLFGTKRKAVSYTTKNIKTFVTHQSKILKVSVTFIRLFVLLIAYPKRFRIALEETNQFTTRYAKLNHLSKIVSVLLYLPHIFHIQWAKDLDRWLFLKEKLGVKIILSLRGAHINYSPLKDKNLAASYKQNFPKVDAFHAVSEAIRDEVEKYNANSNTIEVIHSILSESIFSRFSNTVKKDKVINILSVGRFHWVKGYRYALDAIKILVDKGYAINYTIVASNDNSEEIYFQIHQLGLKNSVSIINGLPHQDVLQKMKSSDLLLLPSLNEGIANVVLEAMCVGLPVISTNCGGMSEVVKHKKTGWLISMRNPDAIAQAIIDFNDLPDEEIQTITKNAFELIKNEFDIDKNLSKFNALYETIINN